MVSSAAKSVDEYLDSLPAGRRIVVGAVRDVVRRNPATRPAAKKRGTSAKRR